ncbi:MAG: hypothetical protein LUO98_01400, partial [Methanoregula sp.]|nr:hypothetical protein [Methanoregula sp.]
KKHITSKNKTAQELTDSMGSPYLKSGEGIIMTTPRVSVDAVVYDVMLTTERLFLTDAQSSRFEPRIIVLASLLSVRGGTTPSREPAIILLFRQQGDEEVQQPVNLVFIQEKNENRQPERDEWVRNLIRLSVPKEAPEVTAEVSVIPDISGEVGLRPTARHGLAPERVRPLSSISVRQLIQAPVTVIPDETGTGGGAPPAMGRIPEKEEVSAGTGPKVPVSDITPVHGTPLPPPAPPRVIIPQIIEELLPAHKRPAPPSGGEAAPVADSDAQALLHPLHTGTKSLRVTEERTSSPLWEEPEKVPEPVAVPQAPLPVPPAAEPKEVPDIIRALLTGPIEPAEPQPPEAEEPVPEPTPVPEPIPVPEPTPVPEPVPEPVLPVPAAGPAAVPEQYIIPAITENIAQEPVSCPATEPVVQQAPAAEEERPVRHPIPPAREIRPLRTTLAYAGAVILLIALAAVAAILLFPHGTGDAGVVVTLAPAVLPAATQSSGTPRITAATTIATPAVSPAPTPIATPVLPAPVVTIPQTGVWVRVNSTGYYAGHVGNPGALRQVSGSGDAIFPVLDNDGLVQANVQRLEYSGGLLTVEIYRDGTLIKSQSVTAPMGTVALLINPVTGKAPGLTENDTLPEHDTGSIGRVERY